MANYIGEITHITALSPAEAGSRAVYWQRKDDVIELFTDRVIVWAAVRYWESGTREEGVAVVPMGIDFGSGLNDLTEIDNFLGVIFADQSEELFRDDAEQAAKERAQKDGLRSS